MRLDLFNCFILKISFIYKSYITKKEIRGGGGVYPTDLYFMPPGEQDTLSLPKDGPTPSLGRASGRRQGRGGGGSQWSVSREK